MAVPDIPTFYQVCTTTGVPPQGRVNLRALHSSGMLDVYIYPRDRTGHIHNPLLHCAVFYGVPNVANIMKMVLF